MSWLATIITVGALVFVIAIVLRLTAGVARTVFTTFVSLLLLFGIGWVGLDIWDLQKNFGTQQKLMLLDVNDEVQGAFVLVKDKPRPLAPLTQFNQYYPERMSVFTKKFYKIIVFKKQAFENVQEIRVGDVVLSKKQFFEITQSPTPIKDFVETTVSDLARRKQVQAQLLTQHPDPDQFKSYLFALVVSKMASEDLLEGLRKKFVIVIPETATFKLLKVLPLDWMAKIVHSGLTAENGTA